MVEARSEVDSEAEVCGILQLLDLDQEQHELEPYLVVLACSTCLDLATVDLLAEDILQQYSHTAAAAGVHMAVQAATWMLLAMIHSHGEP